MPAVSLTRHFVASVGFSLVLAVLVITVAGYYETPSLLAGQILFIAGPTLGPFLILPKQGKLALGGWIFTVCVLIAGWSYVAYVDTRPYTGGGASFALLFGWFTCVVAFLFAALIAGLQTRFGGRR